MPPMLARHSRHQLQHFIDANTPLTLAGHPCYQYQPRQHAFPRILATHVTHASTPSTLTYHPPFTLAHHPRQPRQHASVTNSPHTLPTVARHPHKYATHTTHLTTSSIRFFRLVQKFLPLKNCHCCNFDLYFDQEFTIIKRYLQVYDTYYSKFGLCHGYHHEHYRI